MKTDVHLQRDVLDELDWDPSVEAAQIGVTVKEGVVTLTGHVPVYAEKLVAEEAAKRVHGVKAVANELEVRPPEGHKRDDADLAAAAVHALLWDASVPEERIQVTVRDGMIELEGSVERHVEKRNAERAVRRLQGVRAVDNRIVVRPRQAAAAAARGLEAAIQRSATVNAKRVSAVLEGETVVLTGDVHSHAERDEAERIAWVAPGVLRVENCITVTPGATVPPRNGDIEFVECWIVKVDPSSPNA